MGDNKNQIDSLIESINKMSMSEMTELIAALQEKFGISPDQLSSMGGASSSGATQEETKKDIKYNVIVKSIADKISGLKAIKGALGIGLAQAGEIVTSVMGGQEMVIKDKLSKADADKLMDDIQKLDEKKAITLTLQEV